MYTSTKVELAKRMNNGYLVMYAIFLIFVLPTMIALGDFNNVTIITLIALTGMVILGVAIYSMITYKDNWIIHKLIGEMPVSINGFWYTGKWYSHPFKENPLVIDRKPIFDPFKTGLLTTNEDHLVHGLIPAYVIGDKVGLYSITKHYRDKNGGDDTAGWDNGMLVNLKLNAIENKETVLALMSANIGLTRLNNDLRSRINPLASKLFD